VPYRGEQSPNDPALTGLDESDQPLARIPVGVDAALVAEGQERYEIFCTPCHGATGEGNGRATTFGFPKPPSLLDDFGLSDGELFAIITHGQGQMFPYGYRVKPDERWAVIAYIRALQLRGGALNPAELTADELNRIGAQP
jgi:mono/diheme cytochrome c family protein